jgi:hypothetical protein
MERDRIGIEWLGVGAVVCALALPSCGDGRQTRKVYPTTGEVYVNGAPAAGAMLVFQPASGAVPEEWPEGYPRAVAGADGKFAVSTYGSGDGCPEGEYVVTVTWPAATEVDEEEEAPEESADRLGGRYADPATSQLRAKVEGKPTQLQRFELK